jgi:cytoskeletal protein RodZ
MIENFGSYLKHERELRGVPLEEISRITKIHIRFLEALEDNRFDELPGEVFIKGYIRSYANIIGSDVDEMLNSYEESIGNKSIEKGPNSQSKSTNTAKKYIGFVIAGLSILALLFFTKFIILDKNNPTAKIVKPSSSILGAATKKETLPKITENSSNKELAKNSIPHPEVSVTKKTLVVEKQLDAIKPKPELQKQKNSLVVKEGETPGNIEKPLKLTIKVKNNSWFNITIDDFREEDFILSAGEEKSYRGNEIFRLTIGNKQGTDLILNGKSLVIPESEGNIVKDIIINSKLID